MEKEEIMKRWDKVILIVIAVICGIIMFLGLPIFSLNINYAYVSCVLLSAIVIHFILLMYGNFGQKEIENKIDNSAKNIIDSLDGVKQTKFETIKEADNYVEQRIKSAKLKVYDLNWLTSNKVSNQDDEKDRIEKFHNRLNNRIEEFNKNKKSEFYREIFIFHYPLKVSIMKSRLYYEKYFCKYYEDDNVFPKIQFVIIDDEEVIFISSLYQGNLCAVRDKKIVNLCILYFDAAWENAETIKTSEKTDMSVIQKIETKYLKS